MGLGCLVGWVGWLVGLVSSFGGFDRLVAWLVELVGLVDRFGVNGSIGQTVGWLVG